MLPAFSHFCKNFIFFKKRLQSRSTCAILIELRCAAIAQLVERILGKDEVSSSNLDSSSSSDTLKS